MRNIIPIALLACIMLAGCSGDSTESPSQEDSGFEDINLNVSETTGAIIGVVVDDAIRPITGATVTLVLDSGRVDSQTDEQGRFAFDGLAAGTYILEVKKPGYVPAQSTADVQAGVDKPPLVKILLERLFSQDPYMTEFKSSGFITCAYHALLLTAPCVTDYTSISPTCPGGCAPELREVQGDKRSFEFEVEGGWQTIIFELVWEASAEGTSDEMGVTVSHTERTSGHWYASADSASPLYLRIEEGVAGPSPQNDGSGEDMIPPEGKPNLLAFVGIGSNDLLAAGLNQDFELFAHMFYYAPAPEGWSFVAEDAPPF